MGSLMSGWNSVALDPKAVKFRRNKSLTRDEIDAFWKAKDEEEHNGGINSPVVAGNPQENMGRVSQIKKFQRSESLPLSHRRESVSTKEEEVRSSGVNSSVSNNQENMSRLSAVKKFQRSESLPSNRRESMLDTSVPKLDAGKHVSRQGWWTTCSSSFLNETPLMAMDGPAYKYASQYHYTRFGS